MSAFARYMRQSLALRPWTDHPLLVLLLGGVLVFSGCGLGSQENQDNTSNILNGIVALSASDAWTVGWASGQGSSPLIEHWDGRTWSQVPAPGKGEKSWLISVAASSAQDVWTVGDFFQGSTYETLIEHWNGTAWNIVQSPNGSGGNVLRSIAAVSATDAWAVGETDPCPLLPALALPQSGNALARARPAGRADACTAGEPPQPLIEHWDGRAWSIVPSPNPFPVPHPSEPSADLSSVVALSANEVWASGSYFDLGGTPAGGAALVEQWDGTTWRIRTDFDRALGGMMWATAFFSNRNIWGAEYPPGTANNVPTLQHWNGSTWSVVDGPQYGAGGYFVGAMAGSAPDDLWTVGDHEPAQPASGRGQVFSMHWNGSTWNLVPSPTPAGGNLMLMASASLNLNDAWMVGQYSPSERLQRTFIEHWNGNAWSLVPNPNPAQPAPAGQ